MIIVNTLANTLPINGVKTGDVSERYPNLFTPAPFTFVIWGIIYLLLACFVIYQFIALKKDKNFADVLYAIGPYFIISSAANAAWILAWHYNLIPLTVILMFVILSSLIIISLSLNRLKLSPTEALLVKVPFNLYFGWITVATIANITVLLVYLNWNGWGIPEQVWTSIIILVGLVIASLTLKHNESIAYAIAVIWAYLGILLKHTSSSGFSGEYPIVIVITIISLAVLLYECVFILPDPSEKKWKKPLY
ncbi:MAG: tryptophan-rich sensory protein [Bacillota bacterium]|nr:tryptophan-rich sensory protein [Bacillota bacterium]